MKHERTVADTPAPAGANAGRKLYVLDTSVLMHDPTALKRFKEHDIFIPRQVIAQLDHHKKDPNMVGRNAREVSRVIDSLVKNDRANMVNGVSLEEYSDGAATGRLFVQVDTLTFAIPKDVLDDEADRRILSVACALGRTWRQYERVVLVTKDINLRLAGVAVGNGHIVVEDYRNDRAFLRDSDVLPTGIHYLSEEDLRDLTISKPRRTGIIQTWVVEGEIPRGILLNECLVLPSGEWVKVRRRSDERLFLEAIADYKKNPFDSNVRALNAEQVVAFNHLLDPAIDLTILLGDAGAGKTFCAVAAARHLLRDPDSDIARIITTRAMIPGGGENERIGFLPGEIHDKVEPWKAAVEDAKDALEHQARENGGKRSSRPFEIEMTPIGFIAGRTIPRTCIIIDEAQNLTPHQMKLLITRAGEGAKIIVCGNLGQIDTPYLDERSSGLAYLVMRMRGQPHVAHVILQECVRSRLAALAVELL